MDLKRGYGWKQDATAMKYLSTRAQIKVVKMTGLITGSRKANKTHKHSPEVQAMPKPRPGVRTNARAHYFAVWSLH